MAGGHGSRADNLKAQRGTIGVTELARKANVSDQTIKTLENGGSASPEVIQRIADALGITTSTLGKADLFK